MRADGGGYAGDLLADLGLAGRVLAPAAERGLDRIRVVSGSILYPRNALGAEYGGRRDRARGDRGQPAGLTLDSAARSLGISPETARTYLKRVKAKYHQAGLPVYTKLDLAEQVRADCTAGTCPRAAAAGAGS